MLYIARTACGPFGRYTVYNQGQYTMMKYVNGAATADYRWHEVAKDVLVDCKDEYARAYARAMMSISPYNYEAMSTQAVYILSNAANWRGDVARATKAKFKALLVEFNKGMPR